MCLLSKDNVRFLVVLFVGSNPAICKIGNDYSVLENTVGDKWVVLICTKILH